MPIKSFLREAAFEQADIDSMVAAYEAALELLRLKDRNDPICEIITKKIIEVTRNGKHEAPRICARAVIELGIPLTESAASVQGLGARHCLSGLFGIAGTYQSSNVTISIKRACDEQFLSS